MKESGDIAQITIRVPAPIKEQLKSYFWKRGMDLSNGIRATLYRLLDEEKEDRWSSNKRSQGSPWEE